MSETNRYQWTSAILRSAAFVGLLSMSPALAAQDEGPCPPGPLTAQDAKEFVAQAEEELLDAATYAAHAQWVQATYITVDSQVLAARASNHLTQMATEYAKKAGCYDDLDLDPVLRRKLDILERAITVPAPEDPELAKEMSTIQVGMESMYGSYEYCPEGESLIAEGEKCLAEPELTNIMAESRDPDELLEAWTGWHQLSIPMKDDYARFIELGNLGAEQLGYPDVGAIWRSKYDMPADDFAAELKRLWGQVKPLYNSLHCYVRSRLNAKYGDEVVPPGAPIPAHLLGNMWAQEWGHIYEMVAPAGAQLGYDLTALLKQHDYDPIQMVETGEAFFTSLGFKPLPDTFWERSLFTKPEDREVVCHASAWNVDQVDDLRIKMCIEVEAEDFQTIHHELGHNFYQRAYNDLSIIFRNSANDGFHEALGDTIALSVTPSYLKEIGLLEEIPDASSDIAYLLRQAMDKVAFLPFGLMIDQWRWEVYSGEIKPSEYNEAWWELRRRYQGVQPPTDRPEEAFDPGAKYHIPASVPYTRYFLARILQFQFHRALCEVAGFEGPLHRCSIYVNKAAGERLRAMMVMGASQPWPVALEALTGETEMDATAILDYFAPLQDWLDEQNSGNKCGW